MIAIAYMDPDPITLDPNTTSPVTMEQNPPPTDKPLRLAAADQTTNAQKRKLRRIMKNPKRVRRMTRTRYKRADVDQSVRVLNERITYFKAVEDDALEAMTESGWELDELVEFRKTAKAARDSQVRLHERRIKMERIQRSMNAGR